MQYIKNSYCYYLWLKLTAWLSGQWNCSVIIQWFVNQKQTDSRLPGFLAKLTPGHHEKLAKLLDGSIFLHPELFAAAAILLAPVCPTMVVFAAICGGFLALILRTVRNGLTFAQLPVSRWILIFAFIYCYATFTSVSISGSLFDGAITVLFILSFLLVISCSFTRKQFRWLLYGILLIGTLVACYGFYQKLNPGSFRNVWTDADMFSDVVFRVYATLENPNVLGEYFLLVIPIGVAAVFSADSLRQRLFSLAACAAMLVCLVLTYSRGCYLGILFAAVIFLVLLDRRMILVGIIGLCLCPFVLPESVLNRFTSIGNLGDTSTSYRVYIWLGTIEMLKDYWFSGIGPGTTAFNQVYPKYAYSAITAPHSHNLFLQLFCDTGICGFAIFIVLLISWYRMMFTALHREQDRKVKLFQIASISAVSGFLVESMTDYTFYNYRVLLMFWCFLGFSALFTRLSRQEAPHPEVEK